MIKIKQKKDKIFVKKARILQKMAKKKERKRNKFMANLRVVSLSLFLLLDERQVVVRVSVRRILSP